MLIYKKILKNLLFAIGIAILGFLIAVYLVIPYIWPELTSAFSGKIAPLFSIMIYIAAILTAIRSVVLRNTRRENTSIPFILPMLAYMILGILVNIISVSVDYSRWGFVFIALPVHYMVVANYAQKETIAEQLMMGVVTFGILISILLTFTDASGNFPSLAGVVHHRGAVYLFGRVQGPVTLSSISGLSLVCVIVLVLTTSKKWISTSIWLFIPFLVAALVFSGGRAALIAIFLSLLLTWFLRKGVAFNPQYLKPLTLVIGGRILVAIFGVVWLASRYNYSAIERVLNIPNMMSSTRMDSSILERVLLWSFALSTLRKYPLGIGIDSFFESYRLSTHNEFLNIALGAGVFGFVAYIILGALLYYRCYLGFRHNNTATSRSLALTAFSGGVFMFFVSFSEAWSYSNTFLSIMIWTILAIGVSVSRNLSKT